jgi:hypothetical protein
VSDPQEAGFVVWVKTIESVYKTAGQLPTPDVISSLAAQHTAEITDSDAAMVVNRDCLVAMQLATSWKNSVTPASDIYEAGRKLLGDHLKRMTGIRYGKLITDAAAEPSRLIDLNRRMEQEITRIEGSISTPFDSRFPGGYFVERPEDAFQPVGIDFVDILLAGGLADSEVVGHAAPVGQGKTTLVCQICHARATSVLLRRFQQAKKLKMPVDMNKLPQIYFVIYENPDNLLINYISNAALIPRNIVLEATLKSRAKTPFSSSAAKSWRDWERKRWKSGFEAAEKAVKEGREPVWPKGDLERFEEVVRIMNAMVQIVDFSGHTPGLMDMALRGPAGIAEFIRAHQDRIGNPGVNFVACDFIGAMADVMEMGNKLKSADRSGTIRQAPFALQREVAAPFSCPVWAAHQLNPSENKKRGGSIPDPTAAEGSGMFLTYCSVGFASGMLNKENVSVYKLHKSRRQQASASDLLLGRLDKTFAKWMKADDFAMSDGVATPTRELASRGGKVPGAGVIPPAGGLSEKFN